MLKFIAIIIFKSFETPDCSSLIIPMQATIFSFKLGREINFSFILAFIAVWPCETDYVCSVYGLAAVPASQQDCRLAIDVCKATGHSAST